MDEEEVVMQTKTMNAADSDKEDLTVITNNEEEEEELKIDEP